MLTKQNCEQFVHEHCLDCLIVDLDCEECAYNYGVCTNCALTNSLSCDKFREEWESEQIKKPFVCLEPSCYACCNLVNGRCTIDGEIHNDT